jgi:hypothetical protein
LIYNIAWVEDGGSEGEKRRKERKEGGEGRTENIAFRLSVRDTAAQVCFVVCGPGFISDYQSRPNKDHKVQGTSVLG